MASGQVVGMIDDLPSCADLIQRVIAEANDVLRALNPSRPTSK
jgi:NAD(P)H-dependent flavin oxidoreductase YrpB (nitropropane dioxygenase family)